MSNPIATAAASRITGLIRGAHWTSDEELASDINLIIAAEYKPVMDCLREALRFSYIVGIDDPASGRVSVCNGCLMETRFPYEHPFDPKEVNHYSSDCWVSRAQKI